VFRVKAIIKTLPSFNWKKARFMKDKPVVSTRVCSLIGRRDTSRSPRNAKSSSARRAFFKSSRDIPREKARYVFGSAALAGAEAPEALAGLVVAGVVVPEALIGAEAPEALAGLVVAGVVVPEALIGAEAPEALAGLVVAGVVAREALAGSEPAGAAVPAGSGDREKLWAERGRLRVASWKQKTKKETALIGVPG
jgi:hypothetical protein